MTIPEKFTFFWRGEFSQWYPAKMTINNIEYNTCEQYMMASKAIMFNDRDTLVKIMNAKSPRDQKALGREVKNFDKDTWETEARNIIYNGNLAKFSQHPTLRAKLLATEGTLVEASPKDCIYGIGLAEDDPKAQNRTTWLGTNWLGEVLTRVRETLKINNPIA